MEIAVLYIIKGTWAVLCSERIEIDWYQSDRWLWERIISQTLSKRKIFLKKRRLCPGNLTKRKWDSSVFWKISACGGVPGGLGREKTSSPFLYLCSLVRSVRLWESIISYYCVLLSLYLFCVTFRKPTDFDLLWLPTYVRKGPCSLTRGRQLTKSNLRLALKIIDS